MNNYRRTPLKKAFLSAFLLGLVAVGLLAGSPRAASTSYVLGMDDVVSVAIFAGGVLQTPEFLEIEVSSKGTINFPFLGRIKAEGLTVSDLSEIVTNKLAKDYFVDPQVNIRVTKYKSKEVYITGAVRQAGLYPLEPDMTLLELIAKAGGVTVDRGQYAFILKSAIDSVKKAKKIDDLVNQKKSVKVDLRELMDRGRADLNVALEEGDVLYVQPLTFAGAAQHKIYVLGRVNRPGAYNYQEGMGALDACVEAGGFSRYSAPNRTVVTRRKNEDEAEEKAAFRVLPQRERLPFQHLVMKRKINSRKDHKNYDYAVKINAVIVGDGGVFRGEPAGRHCRESVAERFIKTHASEHQKNCFCDRK